MDNALRHAWMHLVSTEDIDAHLHEVGQAAANAALLVELLQTSSSPSSPHLLIAGAGTAQFLDYLDVDYFRRFEITLTDINPNFLELARERFSRAGLNSAKFVIDDIEATGLSGTFDVAAMVLVLEHIDWRLGLQNLVKIAPNQIIVIIQRNPENLHSAIAPQRKLNNSMRAFATHASPSLINADQLVEFLGDCGYVAHERTERAVADGKTMVGFSLTRER